MITQIEGIQGFEKLFNCTPPSIGYDEVSEEEYDNFINNCIRQYRVMKHTGGCNIYNRQDKIVAFRCKDDTYFITKKYRT